jgi:hypothetical protein
MKLKKGLKLTSFRMLHHFVFGYGGSMAARSWMDIQGTAIQTAGGAIAAISATVTLAPLVGPQTPIRS